MRENFIFKIKNQSAANGISRKSIAIF